MKKIGRPKVESPKNVDIKVRIDEETNKKLNKPSELKGNTGSLL